MEPNLEEVTQRGTHIYVLLIQGNQVYQGAEHIVWKNIVEEEEEKEQEYDDDDDEREQENQKFGFFGDGIMQSDERFTSSSVILVATVIVRIELKYKRPLS